MPLFLPSPWNYIPLVGNFVNSTTTEAAVTGVSFDGAANTTYEIEIFGAVQSAATTTGVGLGFDIPADASIVGLTTMAVNTTGGTNTIETIADNTVLNAGSGIRAANTNSPVYGKYLVKLVTAGTVQLVAKSEVAASAVTLMGGLFHLKYRII